MRTRCMDKNRTPIWEGDILHVEEYPDKYVGGSLDFEGVVSIENGRAMVTYYDIGEAESYPISMFPIKGRHVWEEKWRYEYWKTAHLGGEPPEDLWKEELYRQTFDRAKEERRTAQDVQQAKSDTIKEVLEIINEYKDDGFVDEFGRGYNGALGDLETAVKALGGAHYEQIN